MAFAYDQSSPMSDDSWPVFPHCPNPPKGNFVAHHGLITPLASPLKTSDPAFAMPDTPTAAVRKHKERQTTISEHLMSVKKAYRGRPKKQQAEDSVRAKEADRRTKEAKSALTARLESFGFQPTAPQIEALFAVPHVASLAAHELCDLFDEIQTKSRPVTVPPIQQMATPPPERKRKRKDDLAVPPPAPVAAAPRLPLSPPLSPQSLPSRPPTPTSAPDSPIPGTLALYIDPISGQAIVQPSLVGSSLPSLSTGSSGTSSATLSSFGASFASTSPDKRKMTKADVPGMGRVLFERSVLFSRLGEDAAARAIESAEMSTLRRSNLFDAPLARNVNLAAQEGPLLDRNEMVLRWLALEAEQDDQDDDQLAFFQPSFAPLFPDANVDPKEEQRCISQGGKSIRVLKKAQATDNDQPSVFLASSDPAPAPSPTKKQKRRKQSDVNCICHEHDDDDSRTMVQCDSCQAWLHVDCLGKRLADFPKNAAWFCPRCDSEPAAPLQPATEPVFFNGSPRVMGTPNHKNLDIHLFGSESFHTPGRSPSRKRQWSTVHTPSLSKYASSEWSMSFSPRTPSHTFARTRQNVHFGEDEVVIVEHGSPAFSGAPWDRHAMQTPSRSAGLAADWSLPIGTPVMRGKYSAHDFFQDMHTPKMKQQVSFDDSPFTKKPMHRRTPSAGLSSALKHQLQPSPMARAISSGLGIGFGGDAANLDDLLV